MPRLHSRKKMQPVRRNLRQAMPAPEAILWSQIRNRQLQGFRFRRQHSIGRYIVDFYCAEKKVAIELDGDSHSIDDAPAYDEIRDTFIRGCGVTVVRYTNEDILRNLPGVLQDLSQLLFESPTPSAPADAGATPPLAGGELGYSP